MSLLNNNKKDNKKGAKGAKGTVQDTKLAKQSKGAGFAKKPVKTGGSRGS